MVKLLLVRSLDDMPFALKMVSEFLVYQPMLPGVVEEGVLGIWIKKDLEAHLPSWFCRDSERSTGRVDSSLTGGVPAEATLGIRQTVSLCDGWTLCWMDGPLLCGSSAERRDAILRTLVETPTGETSSQQGTFFPVFAAEERPELIQASYSELRARCPHLVGACFFLHDRARGLVSPELSGATRRLKLCVAREIS